MISNNDYHMNIGTHCFNKYFIYNIPKDTSSADYFGKLIFLKPSETNVSIEMANKTILDRKFQSSLSMPLSLIKKIDESKPEMVTRSKYVVYLLEKALRGEELVQAK